MDVIVNVEFEGKLRESASSSPPPLALFAPYGVWHGTQEEKKLLCGRRKSLVFCPSWNLIQKFRILEDKKQTEGEGRKAEKDGGIFF